MRLTPEQQRVVEENMGLVVKVIQDKVHDLHQDSCFRLKICGRSVPSDFVKLQQLIRAGVSLPMPTDSFGMRFVML